MTPIQDDIKQRVGKKIKAARIAKELTLEEAGLRIGVARSTFSLYESGKQNLTIETLQKIAEAFNLELDILFR